MHPLLGYVDRWSAKPGETIKLMVSSRDGAPFEARFARIQCGDPNPRGPGYRETPMAHPLAGTHAGKDQRTHLGSWIEIPSLDLAAAGDRLVICATIWPTTPAKGRQSLVSWIGTDGVSLSLDVEPDGATATLTVAGKTARVATGKKFLERAWYDVWLVVDRAAKTLGVGQRAREIHPTFDDEGSISTTLAALPGLGAGRACLAALVPSDVAGKPSCHYNGKLERPTVWAGAMVEAALGQQRGAVPRSGEAGLVACWDFAIGIDTLSVTDVGPGGFHGRTQNMPTRAMTGAGWSGAEHRWTHRPQEWGAIHFHDDDLGDVGWTPSLEFAIPADWPSGLYAVHLKSANGFDNVPFVVRPGAGAPKAKVAILLPTVSYHIYSNFVRPGWGRQNIARAKEWGAIQHTPDENPELGLSPYNYHSDGSGVSVATMARPMIDKRVNHFEMMDPAEYGSGCYWVNVDSYVIDWLTRKGIAHDVITDHDLHAEGVELLKAYNLVITCQHPEYHTTEMLDGLEGHLARGGRLMYLGGNGFYWKTVFHKEAPYALEVRRAEGGIRTWATEVGESYHAFDGSYGGLWRRVGRPAHKLVGNGFSAQGIYLGFPYTVNDAMNDPRAAFIRKGLESELRPGAQLGERGYMGGGAAGHELDRADFRLGTPRHALVVASAVVDHPQFKPVNEDRLDHYWPLPLEKLIRADMVFFETPAGGAVFSVGSMNFVGSLPIDGYDNLLTRMMTNVVQRFADPTPFG
ncbi:MAG: N,N-dimethylformamidase [Alphaproteobacteria bacterium]|nr:N,N-dimethylformamidase [Alphaproteobacteria bacterium]